VKFSFLKSLCTKLQRQWYHELLFLTMLFLDQPLPRRHGTEANRREQVHRFRVALFRFEKGGHGSTFFKQAHPSKQKRSSKPLLLIGWACPDYADLAYGIFATIICNLFQLTETEGGPSSSY